MKRILSSLLGLCATVIAGCTIEAPDFSGKSCESASDCPAAFTCVAARAGGGRTCEVLSGPGISEPQTGPVPTWCKEIQPILTANCVSTCHGASTSGSGRADFRLDRYETVGSVAGAGAKADRILDRAVINRTMPLPGNPAPTEAELALLRRWAEGSAPRCDEASGKDGGP